MNELTQHDKRCKPTDYIKTDTFRSIKNWKRREIAQSVNTFKPGKYNFIASVQLKMGQGQWTPYDCKLV